MDVLIFTWKAHNLEAANVRSVGSGSVPPTTVSASKDYSPPEHPEAFSTRCL